MESGIRRDESSEPLEYRDVFHGVEYCWFDWSPESDSEMPTVLLAHATGFHARCWDEVARFLPNHRIIAIDFRGHGRSGRPEGPYLWENFGNDLIALIEYLKLDEILGVGHSMGGHSVAYAASHIEREIFSSLLLIDPVIQNKKPTEVKRDPQSTSFVAKRRNLWSSPDELIERFRKRTPHSLWDPKVLTDYAIYGLLPNPLAAAGKGDELFELACPPEIEASVYLDSGDSWLGDSLKKILSPVRIIRAAPPPTGHKGGFLYSPTSPDLAGAFINAEDVLLSEFTHFIPMQDPKLVAEHILEMSQ